jgi:hypothetical protein
MPDRLLLEDGTALLQEDSTAFLLEFQPVWHSIIVNSGLEVDTSSWTAYGGNSTLSRVNEVTAYEGSWEGKTEAIASGDFGAWQDRTSQVLQQGQQYRGRVALRGVGATVGHLAQVVLQEDGGAAGAANGNVANVTLTTSWQLSPYSFKTIAQPDRTAIRMFIIDPGTGAGQIMYWDGAEFEVMIESRGGESSPRKFGPF